MTCVFCDKEAPQGHSYCSYECHVGHAKALGGRVITPNNLPASCFMANGDMLEIEHGDHPNYMHPVNVAWEGELDESYRNDYGEPLTDEQIRDSMGEHHALIFNDGSVALTLHECEYFMWSLKTGKRLNKKIDDRRLKSLEIPDIFKRMKL